MAEQLEGRGCAVTWLDVPREAITKAERLRALGRGTPELLRRHAPHPTLAKEDWTAVIAVHSYMGPYLELADTSAVTILDFVDLEWQRLRDYARISRFPANLFQYVQSHMMRRYETRVLRRFACYTFCNERERAWAEGRSDGNLLLLPNTLPASSVRAARRISEARRLKRSSSSRVVYVGKLTHGPNLVALTRFVERVWPRVREFSPNAVLSVAGDCADGDRTRLEAEPGVSCLGFVEDLEPLFCDAAVAVLPLETRVGTSLRILFYAIAELPLIGSPAAFRGFERPMGVEARTPDQWVESITRALAESEGAEKVLEQAKAIANQIQDRSDSWDLLVREIDARDLIKRTSPSFLSR